MELLNLFFSVSFIAFHIWCIFNFYSILRSGKVSVFWIEADRAERPVLFFVTFIVYFLIYLTVTGLWEPPIFQLWDWRQFFS
jgi:hypothetical protein